MGNIEFKENGVPKIPINEVPIPNTIVLSAEKIVNDLWDNEDIKSSTCTGVQIVDSSNKPDLKRSPYTLLLTFSVLKPYLLKSQHDVMYPKYDVFWSTSKTQDLPTIVTSQLNYLNLLLKDQKFYIASSSSGDWGIWLELFPLSKSDEETWKLKRKIEEMETHISLTPGGKEYLDIQKGWHSH